MVTVYTLYNLIQVYNIYMWLINIKFFSFTAHNYCMYPTDGSTMKSYAGSISYTHIDENKRQE